MRTLVEDIGTTIGCGAFVSKLRRTSVVPYQQNKMYALEELEDIQQQSGTAGLEKLLLPVDSSVQHLAAIKLSSSATFYLRTGQSVTTQHSTSDGLVRIFSDADQFMGIGEVLPDGRIAPRRLISQVCRVD